MNLNFRHFIISRFNIDFKSYLSKFSFGEQIVWMDQRVILFFQLTYPTLISQTTNKFEIILLLDNETPIDFLSRILKLDEKKIINFVFTSNKSMLDDLNIFLKTKLKPNEYLITTALDSDDGLMPFSIEKIQKEFKKVVKFPLGLNLTKGLIVNVKTGVFYKKSFLSNPFYTLFEKEPKFKTCFFKEHLFMEGDFETLEVNDKPYWLQNIHGGNLLNEVKGKPIFSVWIIPIQIKRIYRKTSVFLYIMAFFDYIKRKFTNLIVKFRKLKLI